MEIAFKLVMGCIFFNNGIFAIFRNHNTLVNDCLLQAYSSSKDVLYPQNSALQQPKKQLPNCYKTWFFRQCLMIWLIPIGTDREPVQHRWQIAPYLV
jgi:hypothetical protein